MDAASRVTRAAYDAVAWDYARLFPDVTVEAPLDRAVLGASVEMVTRAGDGVVAEVGCGSGRVMAHLADGRLRVVGLDLSPVVAGLARTARPDLAVGVAHAGALPLRSGALGGLLAWYSLIHLRAELLPGVAAKFARVLRPGAPVLVAFHSGQGERLDRTAACGHPVPLTSCRHRVEAVVGAPEGAELLVHATVRREPTLAHETAPQAFLLAQRRWRPADASVLSRV